MLARLLLVLEQLKGVQNSLAADQRETVLDAFALCEAGQNLPC